MGRIITTHDGLHVGPVACSAFSKNGKLLVTGGNDTIIGVWGVSKKGNEKTALER